ncbi:MAG: response regulator transcription factor [Oligoflexia bacterium]|nr:response regulator transcription factor [Oligoflexia bacterium]
MATPNPSAVKILVVEDERDVRDLMLLHLNREGYQCQVAEDGEQALAQTQKDKYHLLVLDWMLPGVNGLEICKRIRASGPNAQVPVLMVTARADSSDIVLSLEMGADDYVTKPFEIPVFLARVRSLLRRAAIQAESSKLKVLSIGKLKVNLESHDVLCENQKVSLTPSEFKMLVALCENRGKVLSREKLIGMVQGDGVAVIDRTVDTHIFGLRKKLGACSEVVETIRGIGYRIPAE